MTDLEAYFTAGVKTPVIRTDETVPLGCEGEDYAARARRIALLRTLEAPEDASLIIEKRGEEIAGLWRVIFNLRARIVELESQVTST